MRQVCQSGFESRRYQTLSPIVVTARDDYSGFSELSDHSGRAGQLGRERDCFDNVGVFQQEIIAVGRGNPQIAFWLSAAVLHGEVRTFGVDSDDHPVCLHLRARSVKETLSESDRSCDRSRQQGRHPARKMEIAGGSKGFVSAVHEIRASAAVDVNIDKSR